LEVRVCRFGFGSLAGEHWVSSFGGAGVGGGCRGARERASIPPNPDWFVEALHWTARGIEAVGIAIIVLGALVSSFYFLWQLLNS
jgi:hypothetical protein